MVDFRRPGHIYIVHFQIKQLSELHIIAKYTETTKQNHHQLAITIILVFSMSNFT